MFGISGGELVFIIIVGIMLLGPDKIPGAMRTFGKFMANVKHATNEIKTEIQKSADIQDLQSSIKSISNPIENEVERIKSSVGLPDLNNITSDITQQITQEAKPLQENIEDITGPIKRQM
ncbi:Sec-independent protein translocase protein TatB [Flavobacterium croceum]|uniref:Sec-independent protein translocase protein TatA n=1 Tax=Flavobacterium croceum DSM 17960 TaxID=1121886 RepID=A0A2S4N6Z8_9FLAO|nr:Sec-independent protein translocase protein TatB [Flavobacterium croceum]POS01464.1 sec-independent protein translocase protein TatA [Flavobacterium croceum DSM 17960]